jgi:hypothetical protein
MQKHSSIFPRFIINTHNDGSSCFANAAQLCDGMRQAGGIGRRLRNESVHKLAKLNRHKVGR